MTGISAWGVQWERKDDDQEIARRVLNLLEDKRMLWEDYSREIMDHCVTSAAQARRDLGRLRDSPELGRSLGLQIGALQALFQDFMTEVGPHGDDPWRRGWSQGTDPLSLALGGLRREVGIHIGQLSALYDIDVPSRLSTIVPDRNGWFFERIRGE